MNVDSIMSYAIFLATILSIVYFVTSIYPHFEYNYFIEKTKYEKAIAYYDLGHNYEVITKVGCISLPNYFKTKGLEVIGNTIITDYPFNYTGIAVKDGNKTIVYGSEVCFNEIISDKSSGNETSYSVTFSKSYSINGIQLYSLYRKWLS